MREIVFLILFIAIYGGIGFSQEEPSLPLGLNQEEPLLPEGLKKEKVPEEYPKKTPSFKFPFELSEE